VCVRELSATAIIRSVAEEACTRCTQKTIADLQARKDWLLFGEDSGLQNDWDEVCVHFQHEPAYAWSSYEDVVTLICRRQIEDLKEYEREALWLHTSRGEEWSRDNSKTRSAYPVCVSELTYHVLRGVFSQAQRWSNRQIRAYISRKARSDEH
jgi:hypothetical protein